MNKIVLTELFLSEIFNAPNENHKSRVTTNRNKSKDILNKNALRRLRSVFPIDFPVVISSEKENEMNKTTFYKIVRQNVTNKVNSLENNIGKSVNEVLQTLCQEKEPRKNTNLSNYDFKKSVNKYPEIRETLLPMIKKSALDVIQQQMNARKKFIKLKIMEEKRIKFNESLKMSHDVFIKKKHDKNCRMPENFKDISHEMFRDRKSVEILENVDRIFKNNKNSQSQKADVLYQKYKKEWEKVEDFSLKKKLTFEILKN